MGDNEDHLLSAKQIAPLLGIPDDQYKSVYRQLERAGIEPWRDPYNPNSRRVRWWASDIAAYKRQGGGGHAPRKAMPESTPTRFRKQSA